MKRIATAALFAALMLYAVAGHAQPCALEQYFAPEDTGKTAPLGSPHATFRTTQAFAAHGIAKEQRNLAAFYESGYLVSACREKALYWYGKAAAQGDEVAKAWIERNAAMERMRKGPECFGDACLGRAGDGPQKTVLQPGPGGSYTAMVTINGQSLRGVVDTGASYVSLSAKTASDLGISYINGRLMRMRTANGTTTSRAVMLRSVTVGNITLNDVEAAVSESDHPLLIGMSFLKRLNITTSGGTMTLAKP